MAFVSNLQSNLLLAALPAEERQRWEGRLELVDLALGQELYHPGQSPAHAWFPVSAVVSLLFHTTDGDCDEVAVVGYEGVVGVAIFMGSGSSISSGVVQRPGQAYRMRAETLREEFDRSAAVMHTLLRYTMALNAQVAQMAVCNRHHTLDQRLCRRLLQGLDRQRGADLAITHEQLAGLLGVRRETITTEAFKLQQAGAVSYSRGHLRVLDRAALESRACECYGVIAREYERLAPSPVEAGSYRTAAAPEAAGLAGLATYLQKMRDQERGDLARELHDELGALLTCAKLDVAGLKSRLGGSSTEIDERLKHLSEMINNGIAFSRRVVEGLHPSSLTNLGLKASLEILASEFASSAGIQTNTHVEDVVIDETSQLAVYRVVQECLNNASKYSGATLAWVVLLDCGSDIVLSVRDNGRGFEAAAVGTSSHGLAGMRHRVESCGGQLKVNSDPGRGTLITAVLPKHMGAGAAPQPIVHRAPQAPVTPAPTPPLTVRPRPQAAGTEFAI